MGIIPAISVAFQRKCSWEGLATRPSVSFNYKKRTKHFVTVVMNYTNINLLQSLNNGQLAIAPGKMNQGVP